MKIEPKYLSDGSFELTVTIPQESLSTKVSFWDKTDYCVTCKGNKKYTIESYGDIAANIEAAATCMKEVGDPSYGLSKGKCQ